MLFKSRTSSAWGLSHSLCLLIFKENLNAHRATTGLAPRWQEGPSGTSGEDNNVVFEMSQSKAKKMPAWQKWCIALAIAYFCTGPIVATIFDQLPGMAYRFDDRSFDANVWRAGNAGNRCRLGSMTDDLIDLHLKPGVHRKDVEGLLGPPDRKSRLGRFIPSALNHDDVVEEYDLGECSGFQMDEDVLGIHYNDRGLIVDAWHFQT